MAYRRIYPTFRPYIHRDNPDGRQIFTPAAHARTLIRAVLDAAGETKTADGL